MAVATGISPTDLEQLDLETWNRMIERLSEKPKRRRRG